MQGILVTLGEHFFIYFLVQIWGRISPIFFSERERGRESCTFQNVQGASPAHSEMCRRILPAHSEMCRKILPAHSDMCKSILPAHTANVQENLPEHARIEACTGLCRKNSRLSNRITWLILRIFL